jgi:Rieske Fe-S protein
MTLSRRDFTVAAGSVVALTLLGCDQSSSDAPDSANAKPIPRIKLADQPFIAGPIDQYKAAGVYTDFRDTKAVFLVSDGKVLLAFNATCTHSGCTTQWEPDQKDFKCPCHKSLFGLDGAVIGKAPAKRPLERLAIALVAPAPGQAKVVQIDPTQRFKSEDDWSDPAASLKLT